MDSSARSEHPRGLTDLLVLLHEVGNDWTDSRDLVVQTWGRHLLEDWRSLELLAQRYDHSSQNDEDAERRRGVSSRVAI